MQLRTLFLLPAYGSFGCISFVSFFKGPLAVVTIMINMQRKTKSLYQLGFGLQSWRVIRLRAVPHFSQG